MRKSSISELFIDLFEENGVKASEFCEFWGINRHTLYAWLNRRRKVPDYALSMLIVYCRLLKTKIKVNGFDIPLEILLKEELKEIFKESEVI